MSTRLGVKRDGEVVAADKRMGPDGKEYYDIQVHTLPVQKAVLYRPLTSRSILKHTGCSYTPPLAGSSGRP